ncbi:hypothetical protein U8527_13395 [Kordia algicida OT-1]|uniref:Uncharacterized protein n=1 Tax=Kordia algicida OT-1 TaxID=391587 RepID=A9E5P9_9FLAO|nr:hypothetical protein [Kordia algicida]EDP95207.1 hypothetical protein KAOT1_06977 [Kordia algicida OT-1]
MTAINYNKWAFHFSIWIVIIFIVQTYLTIDYNAFTYNVERFVQVMGYLSIISLVLFLLTFIFLLVSIIKKLPKNYQFWISWAVISLYFMQFVIAFITMFIQS